MALATASDESYTWASRSCVLFATAITIFTIGFHIRDVQRQLTSTNTKWSNPLRFTFVLQFLIILVLSTLFYCAFFAIPNETSCMFAVLFPALLFFSVKWALYMLLSYRLDASFSKSAYAYNNNYLKLWRIFLTIACIMEIIVGYLTMTITIIQDTGHIPCRLNSARIVSLLVVIVDIIACGLNSYLFINPLRKISSAIASNRNIFEQKSNNTIGMKHLTLTNTNSGNMSNSSGNCNNNGNNPIALTDNNSNSIIDCNNNSTTLNVTPSIRQSKPPTSRRKAKKFLKVIKKTATLTIVAVSTTFLCLLLIYCFQMSIIWVSLDCVLNMWATLLMFQWNHVYYEKIRYIGTCRCLKKSEREMAEHL